MSPLNRLPSIALALGLAVAATGCHPFVDFTHELRTANGLSKDDLKNLQFYVSNTVTLRREIESGGRQITGNHKLVLVAGKSIEEVEIEAKTPGVAVDVRAGSIFVSFEQGTSLEFAAVSNGRPEPEPQFAAAPDPFPGNHPDRPAPSLPTPFQAYAGSYGLVISSAGTINFQGKAFEAVGDSAQAHLMIKSESLESVVKKNKVLPGLRLPDK